MSGDGGQNLHADKFGHSPESASRRARLERAADRILERADAKERQIPEWCRQIAVRTLRLSNKNARAEIRRQVSATGARGPDAANRLKRIWDERRHLQKVGNAKRHLQ
jgi:hypothetical protein